MINRFFTPEERDGLKKASTPYTTDLAQLVIEALEGSTASEPGYPDSVNAWWARSCIVALPPGQISHTRFINTVARFLDQLPASS